MSCKTVLVVEDDQAVQESLSDVLTDKGYEVTLASEGREAVAMLNRLDTRPCVILLDMMMPGMNGWDFLDYVKSHPEFSQIPVIVCSAFRETALSVKPAAFIQKPITLKQVSEAVRAFCA